MKKKIMVLGILAGALAALGMTACSQPVAKAETPAATTAQQETGGTTAGEIAESKGLTTESVTLRFAWYGRSMDLGGYVHYR